MRLREFALLTLTWTLLAGCSAMSSTMLTRDESNQFWTRNGNLKGVPITLKIPTHVQLTVFERHFLLSDDKGRLRRICLPFVVRDFSQEFIYSEKIFTVDFKRPAAGLYNLHLDLTDDQYISKLQHDVTDTTIQEVTALVKKIFPSGMGARTVTDEGAVKRDFTETQSVVAIGMFEIDAPDFEDQMAAFVNYHLNHVPEAVLPGLAQVPHTGLASQATVPLGANFNAGMANALPATPAATDGLPPGTGPTMPSPWNSPRSPASPPPLQLTVPGNHQDTIRP